MDDTDGGSWTYFGSKSPISVCRMALPLVLRRLSCFYLTTGAPRRTYVSPFDREINDVARDRSTLRGIRRQPTNSPEPETESAQESQSFTTDQLVEPRSTLTAASRRKAQRRCVFLTYIPFRGGEVAEKRPAGWPEWIRASSLSAQGSAVSEPRSQLA